MSSQRRTRPATEVLGVDIGGTGIKAAVVDTVEGRCTGRRLSLATPHPATPGAVAAVIHRLGAGLEWAGPIGVGFPGVVKAGVVETAANLDPEWIGVDGVALVRAATLADDVSVCNDADAAGLAEVHFGAGQTEGVVVVVTLGTGIGTAIFSDGVLLPNTELGHLPIDGADAETLASTRAKVGGHLDWVEWGGRVSVFLERLESLLWPDLIVIGGGISAEFERFHELLHARTPVVGARLGNDAGIIGAAMACGNLQPAIPATMDAA